VELDLRTILFQLANFVLLVVLLRIFLYKPVLQVMDERAEATAAPLREARRLVEEAQQEREALTLERAELDQRRAEHLAAAARDAERLRQERLEAVEREAAALRTAATEAAQRSIARLSDRLHGGVADLVVEEVRHTLGELTGADLDAQAWTRFEAMVRALPAEKLGELASAAREHGTRVVTPRELPPDVETTARTTLAGLLGVPAEHVTFTTDPDVVLGVALESGGLRLDGTASARLEALGSAFADVLRSERA